MDSYDRLLAAVRRETDDAALVAESRWSPLGGRDERIFPPTFPEDAAANERRLPYLVEQRLIDGEPVQTVVLDQVQSGNNRIEEACADAVRAGRLRLPYLLLEHELSTGRTVWVSSFTAPHRYADAYWRDSTIDGVPFDRSQVGQRLRAASMDDCTPLYEREPFSLVLGSWDSHRKGRAARFARVYRSEIFGVAPEFGFRAAGRMDQHNLIGAVRSPELATDGSGGWDHVVPDGRAAKGERLSAIGHGNIAPVKAHGGVTVRDVRRVATLSMAGLARLRFGDTPAAAADAARVALAALALAGDRLAFAGPGLWLRSGCDLVIESETLGWRQRGGRTEPWSLTAAEALSLFEHAVDRAERAGLPMASDVVRLQPGKALQKALAHAYLAADPGAGE